MLREQQLQQGPAGIIGAVTSWCIMGQSLYLCHYLWFLEGWQLGLMMMALIVRRCWWKTNKKWNYVLDLIRLSMGKARAVNNWVRQCSEKRAGRTGGIARLWSPFLRWGEWINDFNISLPNFFNSSFRWCCLRSMQEGKRKRGTSVYLYEVKNRFVSAPLLHSLNQ